MMRLQALHAGAAQPAALTLPMLPYKVVYAARLAEAGLIAPALHYVGLVQAALASFGAKIPPGLLVCRAMVAELEERLRTHATVRYPYELITLDYEDEGLNKGSQGQHYTCKIVEHSLFLVEQNRQAVPSALLSLKGALCTVCMVVG